MSYLQQNVHRACRVGPREACLVCFLSPHYTTLCRQHHRRQCIVPDHFVPYQVSDDGVRYGTACAVPCCVLRVGGRPCVWRLGLCPLVVFGYFVHWGGGSQSSNPAPYLAMVQRELSMFRWAPHAPLLRRFFPHTRLHSLTHTTTSTISLALRAADADIACRYRCHCCRYCCCHCCCCCCCYRSMPLLLRLLPIDATAAATTGGCRSMSLPLLLLLPLRLLPIDATVTIAAGAIACGCCR